VLDLADRRQQARLQKDWSAADRLRAEIAARGWNVTDTAQGPQLSKN
jgi:cysteinyl-tRNA synthetase